MVRRLVLGSAGEAARVLGVLSTWPGDVAAVVDDEDRASTLREESVAARAGDPGDPSTYPEAADVVFVAVPASDARRVAAAAREAFPAARLVVSLGTDADGSVRGSVRALADRVVDARDLVARAALDAAVGDEATRLQRLRTVMRDLDGPLAVVMHDNPDPDAIGSALAVVRLAAAVGLEAHPYYAGEISHQENRALVNLLEIDLRTLDGVDPATFGSVALVDHSRPGVNDGLPEDVPVDVVVDHHPPRGPVDARFVDLRSEAGATSTLLASYLAGYGVPPDRTTATALLYGIRVDTDDFTRDATTEDYEAAAYLTEYADADVLSRVESPRMTAEVLGTLATAIQNREVRDDALVSGVGSITDRDALAQAADRLVGMEGVRMAVVHGMMEDTVYVSARASGADVDLGETLRDAFGAIGSAGGHANMAGAQIPLGILSAVSEESNESLAEAVNDLLARRFFETLEDAPPRPATDDVTEFAFELPLEDG